MSEEEKNKNRVSEPQAEYRKPEIQFFKSFEEMNESQYLHWLSLSPEQRLAEHYLLLTAAYNYKGKTPLYDKIYFPE